MCSVCFPPIVALYNKLNKVTLHVCQDATSGTKANCEADVPAEENMAGENGIIQLVWGEANVLYAYIIQGERESTTPSVCRSMSAGSRGSAVSSIVLP